ncbi:succinate dehydrogenase [Agrobacterium genomosp. 3 str. CIP 111-78]|uniref:Succinate dehydrogenase n=1 Tax=Agrobacterium tumefaciens TaxID=358 RepID=A0AAE6BLL9_AGRTU|nr:MULTISPECIES: succinate dehydrogenase [Agrobacterium tumefaciens complex]MCA2370282.1 succinate dehydrogenase [Agrobacterium tomkonis CIP 111-78]QCM00820.1 succinate dehydrogenase [Agrobacterium tumefaciens]
MGKRIGLVFLIGVLAAAAPAVAAERYKLRAPGGNTAAVFNDVGVWKTAKAAKNARISVGNPVTAQNLECVARPGTKAEVIKREGSVAYVRASDALFGGCKGYVKSEFLSAY